MREYKDLENLSRMIDISAVRTDVTINEIDNLVEMAKKYDFIAAFVMPIFEEYLAEKLKEVPNTKLGIAVGFPSGAEPTKMKIIGVEDGHKLGADEFDMVINVGALKSGMYDVVSDDIKAVVDAADGKPVKSILEIAYLTDDEIKRASEIAVKSGVTFVKTGTGWADKPTTVETIKLIKSVVGNDAKIKAAGGVRSLDTLYDMIDAGCSRFGIGLTSAVKIMEDAYKILGK
ncbi:deoxyribose-phosphate aldolase [uncultured Anaerofustis sp.]|uniref:deoxyribose-phosphate aldolase n=1 Tax=uncultured Anaerofustis sp. TaxID=904996 RepID=UPI0025DA857B|nr:deoxyribose-phosphate aldolase [uncultured Anaerofustis sp.]